MLIPNPHLETPNYSISRLRQDDLSGDVLQASYKLVEKPAEEKPLTAAQEQQKASRTIAVVQGITPTQPAPMKAGKTMIKPSLLGKVFGWLKTLGTEEEQPKAKPVAGKSRNSPRRERNEGGEGGEGSKRGEGGKRGDGGKRRRDRSEKPPVQAEAKAQEPRQQGEREPRPPRQPRPPRIAPVHQAEEKPVLESQVAAPTAQTEEGAAREGVRRRGRRGGRRERERREQTVPNGEATASSVEVPASNVEAAAEQAAPDRLKPSEYVAYPAGYVPPMKPIEYIAHPETLPPAEPDSAVSQPAAAAVSAATTGGEGLIQIETNPAKFSTIIQAPAVRQGAAPRRRQRSHEVYVENEPLVQIETQHPQA